MPNLKTVLSHNGSLQSKFVESFDELSYLVKQLKDGGYTVALTQGVYDMFHVGHGRYLNEGRSHGDVLIVGLDSDELTRSMKGENRPFDLFVERAEILAMLSCVTIIVKRDLGQHKHDLIKLVSPDVLIMSKTTSSFDEEDIKVLSEYCGRIEYLEAKAATSTTAKMLRIMTEGAEQLSKVIQSAIDEYFNKMGVKK